jgi:hypothetical protein
MHFEGGLARVEEGYRVVHHHLQGVKLGIRLCESKRGQSENDSGMIECSKSDQRTYFQFFGQLSILFLVVVVCLSGKL